MADCLISGVILDVQGDPIAGVKVKVVKVTLSGAVIQDHDRTVDTSDADGLVSFILPRNSRAWLKGFFYIGATRFQVAGGVPLDIPDAATATLESLGAAVTGPTTGVTVQDAGSALAHLINTLNFRNGFTVTETPTGVARIDADAAGGGAWGGITGTLSNQTDLQNALNAKQGLDATLTALAGLSTAADKGVYFTNTDAAALFDLTAFGRSLVDDADAAAARTTLGLGTAAVQNTSAFDAAGTAAAAISTHEAAANPHPVYLTQAEGDALYSVLAHTHSISGVTGLQAALDLKAPLADPIFTGSLQLPNGSAPTTNAFGEIAGDNNAWASGRGAVQFFDGTANTYLVGVLASDAPSNGQVPTWNTGGTITWETPSGGGGLPSGLTFSAPDFTIATASDNQLVLSGSATGDPVTIAAAGSDPDIHIDLVPKGEGVVRANLFQSLAFDLIRASDTEHPVLGCLRSRGTPGSEAFVLAGNPLFELGVSGWHNDSGGEGPGPANAGYLFFVSGEDFDDPASRSGYWYFSTTPLGANDNAEQVKIGWTHDVGGGVTAGYNLYLPSVEGQDHDYAIFADAPDAVGQRYVWRLKNGITALYNKDFATLYTAGAADFERIITQFNSNVAQIGVEVGGTGTMRPLELLGSEIRSSAAFVSGATSPPTLSASNFTFTFDEANDQVLVTAKYADGTTIKTGAIQLA